MRMGCIGIGWVEEGDVTMVVYLLTCIYYGGFLMGRECILPLRFLGYGFLWMVTRERR